MHFVHDAIKISHNVSSVIKIRLINVEYYKNSNPRTAIPPILNQAGLHQHKTLSQPRQKVSDGERIRQWQKKLQIRLSLFLVKYPIANI